jgi:hypothetical protein
MAIKQQSSMHETNAQTTLFSQGNNQHHQDISEVRDIHVNRPVAKLGGLGFLSLVATFIGVQLTIMIALMTPRAAEIPPAPPIAAQAGIEAPMGRELSISPSIEAPSPQTADKRFMNGLEVEPAPPTVSDPFSTRGPSNK